MSGNAQKAHRLRCYLDLRSNSHFNLNSAGIYPLGFAAFLTKQE
jgi:hypothetical protein